MLQYLCRLAYHRSQDEAIGSGKVDNLEELINSASKYVGESALIDFLEAVELDSASFNKDDEDDDTPKVTLITIQIQKALNLIESLLQVWKMDFSLELKN